MKLDGVKAMLTEDGMSLYIEIPGMHMLDNLQKVTVETVDQMRVRRRVEEDDLK